MIFAAAHGPSALWYATRGAGAMTLVLLTASVVMGIAEVRRWQPGRAPHFAIAAMHRWVSLVATALLAVHVITTLLDPFPRIAVLNAAIPFETNYRPLWIGFGTLASDLLVALVLTSLVRRRLGYRAWRGVHWLAYACWPVALLHGLGAGSDTKATWMLLLTAACVVAVLVALGGRLVAAGIPAGVRTGAVAAAALGVLGLVAWLPQGPLASGWAGRAGTPRSVLAAFSPRPAAPPPRRRVAADPLARSFSAALTGTIRNGVSAGGMAVVDLRLHLRGGPAGELRIRLGGQALPNGGLQMDRSAVTLGPPARPGEFQGRIQSLQNTVLRALVGSADGRALRLAVSLSLGRSSVTGQVQATRVTA
jgi:DMSO/TMAO reductase YedYZ heme-binding membrane subunit